MRDVSLATLAARRGRRRGTWRGRIVRSGYYRSQSGDGGGLAGARVDRIEWPHRSLSGRSGMEVSAGTCVVHGFALRFPRRGGLTHFKPVVRCDEAAWRLFGISLAGYNALFSLGTALPGYELAVRRKA